MARIARAIAPAMAHHVTQRGNRRQQVFFNDDDYQAYLELMAQWCAKFKVEAWAYCLMPNHVHLIVVPETKDGLALAIGEAHLRYTRRINFREGWRGHLWQGRFSSFILEQCRSTLEGQDDLLVKARPLRKMVNSSWKKFLAVDVQESEIEVFRKHERTGRPMGADAFIEKLERLLGRKLKHQKPGPKKKEQ